MKLYIFLLLVFLLPSCQKKTWQQKGLLYCVDTEGHFFDQKDTNRCGPISLLHLMKFGPYAYRNAFDQLCYSEDKVVDDFIDNFTSTKIKPDKARFKESSGMNDTNLILLSKLVCDTFKLPQLNHCFAHRIKEESDKSLTRRVNEMILHSIKNGMPVLMSIDSYGIRDKKWSRLAGHYMLITGVQPLKDTNTNSFLIEYLNAAGAHHRQAFVSTETIRPSAAFAHYPQGDKWLENNPYLYISAPFMNLKKSDHPWQNRHEYYLTFLMGDLK